MTQRTNLGNIILGMMGDSKSVNEISCYFHNNRIFEDFRAPCNRTRALYEYQISEDIWNQLTGITLGHGTIIELKDGAIYNDYYFDADYRDVIEGRFIYLSINPENVDRE